MSRSSKHNSLTPANHRRSNQDGKNGEKIENCPCAAQAVSFVNVAEGPRVQRILAAAGSGTPLPAPVCPIAPTDFPTAVFSSPAMNVYSAFCQMWNKDQNLGMTVDSKGVHVKRRRHLARRTPPPNADSYSNYNIGLGWKPGGANTECMMSCDDAFKNIGSACASNAGKESPDQLCPSFHLTLTSNSPSGGIYMYQKGSIATGCGTFEYEVIRLGDGTPAPPRVPPPPPVENAQREYHDMACFKQSITQGGAAEYGTFYQTTIEFCDDMGLQRIEKGKPWTFYERVRDMAGVPFRWRVFWMEGCNLEGGATEGVIGDPFEELQADSARRAKCVDI